MFTEMGWLGNDGTLNNETVTADILSLPQEVSALLTQEGVAQCAGDLMDEMAEHPLYTRCAENYSQDEIAELEEVGSMVASFKCFHDRFNQGCRSVIRNQITGIATSVITQPASRTLQYGACFSTCQAANFASTTSCTFGLFFKWTRTCAQVFPLLAAAASG